eukprot:SAG31_NODE_455_length_15433_cov_4.248728_13_plen_34_part_00
MAISVDVLAALQPRHATIIENMDASDCARSTAA